MSVTEELRRVGLKIGLFVEPLFINEGLSLSFLSRSYKRIAFRLGKSLSEENLKDAPRIVA